MKLRNSPRDYARRMEAKSRYSIEDSEGEELAAAGFLGFVALVVLMVLIAMLARGWL